MVFRPKVWVGLTATLATGAISLAASHAMAQGSGGQIDDPSHCGRIDLRLHIPVRDKAEEDIIHRNVPRELLHARRMPLEKSQQPAIGSGRKCDELGSARPVPFVFIPNDRKALSHPGKSCIEVKTRH